MPTKYTQVRDCAVYYHYTGQTTLPDVVPDFSRGRRLLFVHGAGSNGHAWHLQLDAMAAAGHSPFALDMVGHGRSAGVDGLATVRDYTDFVVAFLDALKMKSAVIVGSSMGGAIAMDMALRHPARVEALVLIATAAKFHIAPELVEALRAVTMGRAGQAFNTDGYSPVTVKERFDVVREGWMEQIKTDPRVRYTDILACDKVDLREAIKKIDKPTLILAGADDQGTTVADAELIRDAIKDSRLTVIPKAAHLIGREQPEAANAAITGFLSELGGAAR